MAIQSPSNHHSSCRCLSTNTHLPTPFTKYRTASTMSSNHGNYGNFYTAAEGQAKAQTCAEAILQVYKMADTEFPEFDFQKFFEGAGVDDWANQVPQSVSSPEVAMFYMLINGVPDSYSASSRLINSLSSSKFAVVKDRIMLHWYWRVANFEDESNPFLTSLIQKKARVNDKLVVQDFAVGKDMLAEYLFQNKLAALDDQLKFSFWTKKVDALFAEHPRSVSAEQLRSMANVAKILREL
ncbi:hypothetical protein BS50DRAFT_78657 [Corynespora cassiicola Philippines]|uniref:Uncharacterized protein n=1 Tax=Corynespora cassiicola Philippines TaxID=1448308 RepID=A0A2T2NGS9_CORCC|nr:hypothetical protein BS50DRAFT_78657 [Corynespora cassiicola Philippines]